MGIQKETNEMLNMLLHTVLLLYRYHTITTFYDFNSVSIVITRPGLIKILIIALSNSIKHRFMYSLVMLI